MRRLALVALLLAPHAQAQDGDWIAFAPPPDRFRDDNPLDLRPLNESAAGVNGRVRAKGGRFVVGERDTPIRFWGVNGPKSKPGPALKAEARRLAKLGVNLARIHHGYYDESGRARPEKIRETQDVIHALKAEGIYSHLSIYFPLWLKPKAGTDFLEGYDGSKHPFAALMFNEAFQAKYRQWWRELLTTPDARGRKLIDEPALFGVEVQNEDSFFFWTFNPQAVPPTQLALLERRFGDWLTRKYQTLENASRAWGGSALESDRPAQGRMGFRPLWNVANERTARDRDTARFLGETQRRFYEDTIAYLRGLGFQGLVTASNWTTADNRVLGPIEQWTYSAGDFHDRHGYFSAAAKGEFSEWSLRDGHTYADRSALKFDPEEPGKPREFGHPVNDISYDDKPTMLSETTFNRPSRHRTEGPAFYAAYGALQDTDAVAHFAMEGDTWSAKPGYFMQPWTLMSPTQAAQFPAAARIFRQGLIREGDLLADLSLPPDDVLGLKGTPLPQAAALDELRLRDVPDGKLPSPGGRIDPLIHYAGRSRVRFARGPSTVAPLSKFVDRAKKTVRSSTGELLLDYGKGRLTLDAPSAQGAIGDLRGGPIRTRELAIDVPLDVAAVLAVPLDGKPLRESTRVLVQVMSEERPTGFRSTADGERRRVVSIGGDPWQVRALTGKVGLTRPDAARLTVTALDGNGDRLGRAGDGSGWSLQRGTLYYLVERR